MDDEDQFRSLFRFLERVEAEVGGRSEELLDPQIEAKIRQLAAGKLNGAEQDEVLNELALNQAGIGLLARFLREE